MEMALLGAALVIAAAIITVALIVRRGTAAEESGSVDRMREEIAKMQADLAARLETQAQNQATVSKTLHDRIDLFSTRVNQSLSEQTTKTHENLAKLQERLAVIDTAQKNITELSGQVVGLQDVLANKQARGAFGEIQLADIVRDALPPKAYTFQATLSNGRRADCLIQMPNEQDALVIDAKFPLEGYRALQAAKTNEEEIAAQRLFVQSVKKHINDIADRYIIDGETSNSALMFLPSEAVYGEIHVNFDNLVQESMGKRVYIVSPNTLMATLLTVRAVLRDVEMREQAHLIQIEVGKMIEDVSRLNDRVGNLGKHFGQAEKDIREITTSADKIVRRAEAITEVQLEEPESPERLTGDKSA